MNDYHQRFRERFDYVEDHTLESILAFIDEVYQQGLSEGGRDAEEV